MIGCCSIMKFKGERYIFFFVFLFFVIVIVLIVVRIVRRRINLLFFLFEKYCKFFDEYVL